MTNNAWVDAADYFSFLKNSVYAVSDTLVVAPSRGLSSCPRRACSSGVDAHPLAGEVHAFGGPKRGAKDAAVILPGVTIGRNALVSAHSLVSRDVPLHTVVADTPAKKICDVSSVKIRDGSGQPAYPWTRHFHRGCPEEVAAGWNESTR